MTGARAVLSAPVSVALLPNTFCQKGSFLAWRAEQSCRSTTRIQGRQREWAKRRIFKGAESLLKDTFAGILTPSESKWQVIILH